MIARCGGMRWLIAPPPVPLPVKRGEGTRLRCHANLWNVHACHCSSPSPRERGEGWGEGPNATSFLPGHFGEEALSEGLAQAGEDLLGVEFEEARLVGAGGVKDEVTEAELDIKADALDLLIGIVR